MESQVLREIETRGHEQVAIFNYPDVGLKAIVAIHNTVLGPSLGGCRMRLYTDEAQAIDDALRLAEGMTYKSSIAGLDLGGGKSVVIADPAMSAGRRELFLRFGECLNHLDGRYITAEDMGTSVADIMVMREVTKFAAGFSPELGGGGDPSPWTALGCFKGIIAACERRFDSKDLVGRKIALQGVGHVGMYLVKHLKDAGAVLTVCDTNKTLVNQAVQEFGCTAVDTDKIYDVDAEIFAPCAIGQTINHETLARLKCAIIAGAANNQLIDSSVYRTITDRGIMYCPDFVINAGGVISIAAEYQPGGWKESWTRDKAEQIYHTIHRILDESERRDKFPEVVAVELAKERIEQKRQSKKAGAK